jgi:hypothetical protein
MRNCLVLGSGRSGTSMLAGTLSKAGFFMGPTLMPGDASNPRGYFESYEVEALNEDILTKVVPQRPGNWLRVFFRHRPVRPQNWLAEVPLETAMPCPENVPGRIQALTRAAPFCFKDPRFCYTLPVWRPFLKDAVFVCVFRHPSETADSIVRECRTAEYLAGLSMSFERAVRVWEAMYQHILKVHRRHGQWLFLHYEQALGAEGLKALEEFIEGKVDRDFPAKELRHSSAQRSVSEKTLQIYGELCRLARYS